MHFSWLFCLHVHKTGGPETRTFLAVWWLLQVQPSEIFGLDSLLDPASTLSSLDESVPANVSKEIVEQEKQLLHKKEKVRSQSTNSLFPNKANTQYLMHLYFVNVHIACCLDKWTKLFKICFLEDCKQCQRRSQKRRVENYCFFVSPSSFWIPNKCCNKPIWLSWFHLCVWLS